MSHSFNKTSIDFTSRLIKESLQKLQNQEAIGASGSQLQAPQDPQNQGFGRSRALDTTARILTGTIVDTVAVANIYRVSLERNKPIAIGIMCTDTSLGVYGAKSLTTLLPGTQVECIVHNDTSIVHIIGVVPPKNTSRIYAQQAILHGATRSRVDDAHKKAFKLDANLASATAGRLFDSAGGGESGWVTETGMRMFIDPFMAMFGLDEMSSLSFFYQDMMTKFAAYNLQHWTSVSEAEYLNDQDESLHWHGYATYPWENLGLAARADISKIQSKSEWQVESPYLGKMDLISPTAMPFHRLRDFYGYLGQGGKRLLVSIPVNFSDSGDLGSDGTLDMNAGTRTQFSKFGEGVIQPGLADQSITLDGHIHMQTVKGVSISKRGLITAPTRVAKPEDPAGDNESNYKASGVIGNGAAHKITGKLRTSDISPSRQKIAGMPDWHSYIYNYASLQPFLNHKRDYKVPEESAATYANGISEQIPNISELTNKQDIDVEQYKRKQKIDHRYGEQDIYSLGGSIDITDDGNVVITNGCGAEIRLVNGNIEISCPGDIIFNSGRGTHINAGRAFTARAKSDIELSTSERDIRIKAEQSAYICSGNSGTGGILLESKGGGNDYDFTKSGNDVSFSGVAIKSDTGNFTAVANAQYLRTTAGPIVLDAAKGQADLVTYSTAISNFTANGENWYFNTAGDTVSGPAAVLQSQQMMLPGDMFLGGNIDVDGSYRGNGDLSITGTGAHSGGPFWGDIGSGADSLRTELDQIKNQLISTIPTESGQGTYDGKLKDLWYADMRAGNDEVISKMTFTFCTDAQYKTENYKTYEPRWQQLARITGANLISWEEKAVNDTYPYPGTAAFTTDTLVIQDFTIFDANNSRARDRGMTGDSVADIYGNPSYAELTNTSLQNFKVI